MFEPKPKWEGFCPFVPVAGTESKNISSSIGKRRDATSFRSATPSHFNGDVAYYHIYGFCVSYHLRTLRYVVNLRVRLDRQPKAWVNTNPASSLDVRGYKNTIY